MMFYKFERFRIKKLKLTTVRCHYRQDYSLLQFITKMTLYPDCIFFHGNHNIHYVISHNFFFTLMTRFIRYIIGILFGFCLHTGLCLNDQPLSFQNKLSLFLLLSSKFSKNLDETKLSVILYWVTISRLGK